MPDEEEPDKEIRDNVSPELKPKYVSHNDLAPRGSIGTNNAPSLPSSAISPNTHTSENLPLSKNEEKHGRSETDYEEKRTIALKTGDKEVDAHTSETHQLLSEEEFEKLQNPPIYEAPVESQKNSDELPIALKTGDKDVDLEAAKTNKLVDEEEYKRLQKEAIKEKLRNNRDQNRGRER